MSEPISKDGLPAKQVKKMDEILDDNGLWTKGQVLVHLSMFYIQFVGWEHIVLSFFTGYNPPWTCAGNNTGNISNDFCKKYPNKTFHNEDDFFSKRCQLNASQWTYTTNRKFSFVTEFDLICEKAATAAITCALFHIGCVVGALIIGSISDTYGRKIVIIIGTLVLPVPTLASSFIHAIWQLCVLNFLRGFAVSGLVYIGYVYLTELTPPKLRSISANIAQFSGSVGFLFIALLGYLANNWRMLHVYVTILVLPLWLALCFIPESPRWLISKGRHEEAEVALKKILSNEHNLKLSTEVEETQNKEKMKIYSHLDLVRNRPLLRLTATLLVIWFVTPIMYYTVTRESTYVGGNLYLGFILSVLGDIPGLFIVIIVGKTLGRKVLCVGSCFGTSFLVGCMALVPKALKWRHTIMMVLTVMAKVTTDALLVGLWLWTSELYPTAVRSLGLSVCGILEKLGMVCVPFVSNLQVYSYRLPFILICVAALLIGVAGLTLQETKGQPTRENIQDVSMRGNEKQNVIGVDNDSVELPDI